MADKVLACCAVTFLTVLMGAMGVASLIIASTDGENACQGEDRSGLNLKTWLLGYGIADVTILGLIWLGVAASLKDLDFAPPLAMFFTFLWALFKFSWWIVGIVVLARSNRDCVAQGEDIGVMVMVALCMQIFSCCTLGGGGAAAKN